MPIHATTIELSESERAKLLAARQRLGLTQAAVAAEAGCSREMIAYIESGQKSPGIGLLKSLAQTLGFEVRLALVRQKSSRA